MRDSRRATLILVLLGMWLAMIAAAASAFLVDPGVRSSPAAVQLVLLLNACCFTFFWLAGLKDLVYVAFYYLRRERLIAQIVPPEASAGRERRERVVLLYCTADDFDADSLAASLRQDHPGCRAVILDDSKRPESRRSIDGFAAEHGVEVVRRPERTGFKAGNLNHYLRGREDYDYLVLLDSDEIVPRDFASAALRYFDRYPDAGVVQGNHAATRGRNGFMRLLGPGVQPQVQTFQTVKHRYGFPHLMGHGAMVSRECYTACGGFPEVVMEDLAFTVETRERGYRTVFAPDILCEEEYPVDYLAFKKRHSKWTEGTMEFIRRYGMRVLRSRLAWFEKVDLALSVGILPLAALLGLVLILTNVVVLPLLGHAPGYPLWFSAPSAVFMLAPFVNDLVHRIGRPGRRDLVAYTAVSFLLYGSTFYLTLSMTLRGIFGGRARFVVTPKRGARTSLAAAIRANHRELLFSLALVVLALVTVGTPLPVLMIIVPSYLTVYLSLLGNRRPAPVPAPTTLQNSGNS